MGALVETVFGEVQQELVRFGHGKGADLRPWLEANKYRLAVTAQWVEALAPKLGDASQIVAELERLVTQRRPAEAAWFVRHRKLLALLAQRLVRRLARPSADAGPAGASSVPPDLRTPAERTEANLRAIQVLARGTPIMTEEREILRQYSGWGGLSRKGLAEKLPAEWIPEERGLIHEYYTPTQVARAVADTLQPRLASVARSDGIIVALEPSAGIGRFVEALSGPNFQGIRWYAVEYSRVSGRLLQALRPDIEVHIGPFEEWIQTHQELAGEIDLVVSNPPYGERGRTRLLDRNKEYAERRAYAYQLRRSLDLLKPGGIGVFLIPAGFLTGRSPELAALRARVLRRHHLMAAFRLPSESEDKRPLFPGALLVTDLLFFRARGGELSTVAPGDASILEGRYFQDHPTHLLGIEEGAQHDD